MAGLPIPGEVKKMLADSVQRMESMDETLIEVVALLREIRDLLAKETK